MDNRIGTFEDETAELIKPLCVALQQFTQQPSAHHTDMLIGAMADYQSNWVCAASRWLEEDNNDEE